MLARTGKILEITAQLPCFTDSKTDTLRNDPRGHSPRAREPSPWPEPSFNEGL